MESYASKDIYSSGRYYEPFFFVFERAAGGLQLPLMLFLPHIQGLYGKIFDEWVSAYALFLNSGDHHLHSFHHLHRRHRHQPCSMLRKQTVYTQRTVKLMGLDTFKMGLKLRWCLLQLSLTFCLHPHGGTADAEIKDPSFEKPELKVSPF